VRIFVAVVLVAILGAQADQFVGPTEETIFQLFSSLPAGLLPLFQAIEGVGTLWAVLLVAIAALAFRRLRLTRDLILAGALSWAVSRVLGSVVIDQVGLHASIKALVHAAPGPSFPMVRLAVAVGVVATAGPYIGRPLRRTGQVICAAVVVAGMYVGTSYPNDIIAAIAIGWGMAAVVHLAFGSPSGRPTPRQLQLALHQIGIDASDVHLATLQAVDATSCETVDRDGPIDVKVIGRDEVDAQMLAKTWRFVAYKEPAPSLQLTRLQQVEHEACMTLLADSSGVRVPHVIFVGRAGSSAAMLVTRPISGPRLSELTPEDVSDDLLVRIWREVAKLHAVGITHGGLDATNIRCPAGSPGITSFATASTARTGFDVAKDVAELLASMAGIVGDDRAVTTCASVLGDRAVAAALPFLQPAALGRATRATLGGSNRTVLHRLDDLRKLIAARLGSEPPALRQLQRLRPSSVLLAASSLVAVAVLLDRVGNPGEVWATTRHAHWGWAAAALVASLVTNVPYAVSLMGTIRLRLPLWPTTELQLAMSYSNLVIPVIGGTGFQIRFLQREGADLPSAVTAGGLLSVVGTVLTQLPLFVLALWLSPDDLHLRSVPVSGILESALVLIVCIGVLAALVFGIPRLRRAALPPLEQAVVTIWATFRSRRQLVLLLGGNLVASLLYAFCLLSCLYAFGASLSFWTVIAVNIAVGTVAALIPVPGGSTAVGAVGLTGILIGLGVPSEVAVAATLTNQLAVTYIPAIPGWMATRHLLQSNYL
jgi:glycosyltransferase 2 family protein